MGSETGAFRRALRGHTAGRGKRYSSELKTRAIALARELRAKGKTWGTIAAELGVSYETARRWCLAAEENTPRLREVRIAEKPAAGGKVVVVTAGGARVEGATIAEVITLLRAL